MQECRGGASPERKSPARQVRRVRDFAGSVATLPMLAFLHLKPPQELIQNEEEILKLMSENCKFNAITL